MNHLYQSAKVFRTARDASKSYIQMTDVLVGTYPCRISRSSVTAQKGQPGTLQTGQMRAYFDIDCDVRDGDRLECEGKSYSVMFIYKPNNHHIEADISVVEVEL